MLNQAQVEEQIMRFCDRLEEVTFEIAADAMDFAVADAGYKKAYASALLIAEGRTVSERESQAQLETADEFLAKRIAEARLNATQEAGRNYRAQLDALRSVNSNLRQLVSN